MANFFTDNEDILFSFNHMDLARLAGLAEEDFTFAAEFDHAPADADDAIDNYRRILTVLGELAGDRIAPTAEDTDRIGNTLNDDGSVTYAPGIAEAIKLLGQADLMGFTLPYRFGGLNCPNLVYTMSNEIISRADASLMNIYGLQGIAETINAFASEEIKQEYLPRMSSGEWTGAMVLTEPDAGSDLQAVKCAAHVYQDEKGDWFVHGVKRFITNGCGEVLLVLARSEPEIADGRGLSLLLVERGQGVRIRRLEDKLGIHGSPTCEIVFDHAPAKLIGERQRGLVTYVMSLMNGARVGIAAQSLGIAEAAYRVARDYGHSRRQFGTEVENFPALRELIADMQVDIQAARALTYFASFCVDIEIGALKKLEFGDVSDKDEKKALKGESRKYKRYNAMLTPMSKYYASEMSMRVANGAISVLGGSGYMRDYPVERHLRDSRITTIYEGTSQLQVLAAVRGVSSGSAVAVIDMLLEGRPDGRASARDWPDDLAPYIEQIQAGKTLLAEAVEFVKNQPGTEYMDLMGRRLVDMAIFLIVGAIFADQATASETKKTVLHRWLATKMPELRMDHEFITSGERTPMTDFEALAGPVPVVE
ncbi:MAG: acyl-CoA dehydrogenase family protein [Planctomycetota bacterium]|nr:acyl-CoA dehydrogenase family protein [Planctomycetota bacterium]